MVIKTDEIGRVVDRLRESAKIVDFSGGRCVLAFRTSEVTVSEPAAGEEYGAPHCCVPGKPGCLRMRTRERTNFSTRVKGNKRLDEIKRASSAPVR